MFVLAAKRRAFSTVIIDVFLFLYFLTLSGELLNINIGLFKPRVNHIFAFLLIAFFCKTKRRILLDKDLFWPFLLFFITNFISALLGEELSRSLGYLGVLAFTFVCYFLLPYNLMMAFDKDRVLKIYWSSFLTIGAYAILQVLFSYQGVILPFVTQYAYFAARGQGWNYEPSFYALYMTSFVMFYNARAFFNGTVRWLPFFYVNMCLLFSTSTGIIFSYPIFAVLYLCAGYMNLTQDYVEKVKRRFLQILGFFFTSMAAIWFFFPKEFFITFYKFFNLGFTKHWSIVARWEGIVNAIVVFKENPIFGVGIGGVGPYLYKKLEHENVATTLKEMEKYDPTNVFSEVLASLGLVGMAVFAFLFYRYWKVFKGVMKKSLGLPIQERRTAIALMLSLICALIVLQFNQGLFRSYVWTHAAIALGYFRCLQRGENEDRSGA